MKCAACGYHTPPGVPDCPRCASSPASQEVAEDWYPPRARDRSTLQRATEAVTAPVAELRGRAEALAGRAGIERVQPPQIDVRQTAWVWTTSTASIIPGLGQLLQGRRVRGLQMLGAAVVMVGLAVLTIRTDWSNMLGFLVFLLSLYSVWDAADHAFPVAADHPEPWFLRRARLGLLSLMVVFSAITAWWWLFSQRYEMWVLQYDVAAPYFHEGDGLLVERMPASRLHRGDVIWTSRDAMARVRLDTLRPVFTGGANIERVLGIGGDRISGDPNGVSVNGVRLRPERLPLEFRPGVTFSLTVPAGAAAVWSEAPGAPVDLIPAGERRGRIVAVYEPAARRRWVH